MTQVMMSTNAMSCLAALSGFHVIFLYLNLLLLQKEGKNNYTNTRMDEEDWRYIVLYCDLPIKEKISNFGTCTISS